jgi:hypothetical protein
MIIGLIRVRLIQGVIAAIEAWTADEVRQRKYERLNFAYLRRRYWPFQPTKRGRSAAVYSRKFDFDEFAAA